MQRVRCSTDYPEPQTMKLINVNEKENKGTEVH